MTRFTLIAPLALIALVMTGCVAEPAPVSSPVVEPSEAPTESTEPALRPNPLFAAGCADLLSLDEAQELVSAPLEVQRDETMVPGLFSAVPVVHRGGLSCRWAAQSDRGFDDVVDGVKVLVVPIVGSDVPADARATYGLSLADLTGPVDLAGAQESGRNCFANDEGAGACTIWAFADGTLVTMVVSDSVGVFAGESALVAGASERLELILARLSDAGPQPQRWSAPARSTTDLCGTIGTAVIDALGESASTGGEVDAGLADVTACSFELPAVSQNAIVSVSALHGASWAAGVQQTERPGLTDFWQERRTADDVLWWLSPDGEVVSARAAIGGDLVDVGIAPAELGLSAADAAEVLGTVMDQFAEAPPGS
jgi:hypothetical protein